MLLPSLPRLTIPLSEDVASDAQFLADEKAWLLQTLKTGRYTIQFTASANPEKS